jgi:hypothetical protein
MISCPADLLLNQLLLYLTNTLRRPGHEAGYSPSSSAKTEYVELYCHVTYVPLKPQTCPQKKYMCSFVQRMYEILKNAYRSQHKPSNSLL